MAVTGSQIQDLLSQIKTLLGQIVPLREKAASLKSELASAQRDYERIVGELNAEARSLRSERAVLRAALANKPKPPHPTPPPPPTPPPDVPDVKSGHRPPPPPPESPRAVRKRILADHIFYFLDDDQEEVLQVLHALQDDDRRDMGDMLEILPWGEIWQVRAAWESLDQQHQRLTQWRSALESRLTYWQRTVNRLQDDQRQGLLEEKNARNAQEWQVFLEELSQQQEKENERLRHEVQVLRTAWQAQQAPGGPDA